MVQKDIDQNHPCFSIGVAARMVGVQAQTLRYYEKLGLVNPSRSHGHNRLYSREDIRKLVRIRSLTQELGLTLPAVEVIMRMSDQMAQMDEELQQLRSQIRKPSVSPVPN